MEGARKSPQRTRKHFALRYGGIGGYHHSRRHLNASGGALPVDDFFKDLLFLRPSSSITPLLLVLTSRRVRPSQAAIIAGIAV